MADKRMISKSISISEKVNELPEIFDMLLFTWMIPHTDDFGRMTGTPIKVKALVVPMLDKSVKEVAETLQRLNDSGLIHWYEIEGDKLIQVINFDHHQSGLHKRTKSKFPEFPGTSRKVQEIHGQENLIELKRREEKGTEENQAPPQSFALFQNEIGMVSSMMLQQLQDDVETYGDEWVCDAIREAVMNNVRKYPYVRKVLSTWSSTGRGSSKIAQTGKAAKTKAEWEEEERIAAEQAEKGRESWN